MRILITAHNLQLLMQRIQVAISDRKMAYIALRCAAPREEHSDKSQLELFASESLLDVYVESECSVQSPGQCFVAAKLFSDMVRQLPEGEVGLSMEGAFLVMRMYGDTHFEMKVPHIPEYQWISEPAMMDKREISLVSERGVYMILQVFSCIQLETSSYEYSEVGYLHQIAPGTLRLVGTDSVSLSYCDVACDAEEGFLSKGLCLSRKALTVFSRVCEQGMERVTFSVSGGETLCCVSIPGYRVYIRVSCAVFPRYEAVLPRLEAMEVTVSRQMLLGMLRRVMLVSSRKKIIRIDVNEDLLRFQSAEEESSGKEEVRLEKKVERPFSFGLKGEYILQVLTHLATSTVTLCLSGVNAPFFIYAPGELQGCESRHITAPIQED